MNRPLPFLALALVACGGAPPEPVAETTPLTEETVGGEEPVTPEERTTVPVPVPVSAVARESLSEPLQRLWEQVEETIAQATPEPPEDRSAEGVRTWTETVLRPFLEARGAQLRALAATYRELGEEPAYERAVGAGLLGYCFEHTAAVIRGVPIPDEIRNDVELLRVYVESLDAALLPIAREAFGAYGRCAERFGEAPGAWGEWQAYCADHALQVQELYAPQDPAAPESRLEGLPPALLAVLRPRRAPVVALATP